jgi:hypothetical protein
VNQTAINYPVMVGHDHLAELYSKSLSAISRAIKPEPRLLLD